MIISRARRILYVIIFALTVCFTFTLMFIKTEGVFKQRQRSILAESVGASRYMALQIDQVKINLNSTANITVNDAVAKQDGESIINQTVGPNATKQSVESVAERKVDALRECKRNQETITGRNFYFDLTRSSREKLEPYFQRVKPGGLWSPTTCAPPQQVAIIVPYRDRAAHLEQFLNYIHPFLQHQLISYGIFVIEQVSPNIFNKASIMNTGFIEVNKLHPGKFDCFFFHDVDLLPENDRTLYACKTNSIVVHLASYISIRDYKLPKSHRMSGGVVGVRPDTFKMINGYSNEYWGWGGEDFDLLKRIEGNKIKFEDCDVTHCTYWAQKHERDQSNPENKNQMKMYRAFSLKKAKQDGLKNVKYLVSGIETNAQYTKIRVSITLPINKRVKLS